MAGKAEVAKVTAEIDAYLKYMKDCGKQMPSKVYVKQKHFQAMLKAAKDKDVFVDVSELDGKLIYKKLYQVVST